MASTTSTTKTALTKKVSRKDPRLVAMLRTAVLAFAIWSFAWDLTTGVGSFAIVAGAIAGGLSAQWLANSHWRLWRCWAVVLLVAGGSLGLSYFFLTSTMTGMFNPAVQLDFSELFRWFGITFGLIAGLRTQSARYPSLVAFELALAAVCMATALSWHRDGAVNRPAELGDFAWSHGADPARYIIYAGCIASAAALLMLFREKSLSRTFFHLVVIAIMFSFVLTIADEVDLPDPVVSQHDVDDPWGDDLDLEANWGPTRDGDDQEALRHGDGMNPGEGRRGEDEEGRRSGREDGEDGREGQGDNDPWSEFDEDYFNQVRDGSAEGNPSDGSGGGSGNSRPPREDNFAPDTADTDTPPGGARIIQVYTPELTPFERGNVFDGIKEDGTFFHRLEERNRLKVGKKAKNPIVKFDGDVRLRVRPGYVTPLPSVSPDMEITEYTSEPPMTITFSKDGGGNFWVTSNEPGIIRLKFKVTAHKWYFGGELPEGMNLDEVPQHMLVPLPAWLHEEAEEMLDHIGIDREAPLHETLPKLVAYYRDFEDVSIPDKPENLSYFKHLSLERKGVCRHRAYGFMIAANALGLPTRFVTNDVHAFPESWLPGVGWKLIDTGGREMEFNVTGPSGSEPFIPPYDPFPQPENYRQNKEAFEKALKDPKRRRKLRDPPKRLTPEEYMAKYPDRCRKKRKRKTRRSKHDWSWNEGTESPEAVIVLHGDYSPPSSSYYFRQRALSFYDGCRFLSTRRRDADRDLLRRYPASEPLEVKAPPPAGDRILLETTLGEMVTRRQPVALEGVTRAERVRNPDPGRFYHTVRMRHLAHKTPFVDLLGRDVVDKEWSSSLIRHYLRKPLDARYVNLANEIVGRLPVEHQGDPLRQAAAILTELETTGIYDTSVSYADDQTEDPVATFLFESEERRGHAIHFAHAMALLLRARGIPSRLVEGYVSPEANRRGGTAILLREVDAHVWPEIYVENVGWIPVDPVPEQTVSEGVTPPDPELQRMLGEMLRGKFENEDADAATTPKTTAHRSLGKLGRGFLTLVGYLLLLALAMVMPTTVGVKTWRRLAPRFANEQSLHRLAFRATLDRLAEAGYVREFGETREAFAKRLRDQLPTLERLTGAHMGIFLGSSAKAAPDELRNMAGSVRKELSNARPWWRRLLGFFNPATLWWAR